MSYQNPRVAETAEVLKKQLSELANKAEILRAPELKALFDELKTLPADQKASFGADVNQLRQALQRLVD